MDSYCPHCGAKMVLSRPYLSHYDIETGKEVWASYDVCPNYSEILGFPVGKHLKQPPGFSTSKEKASCAEYDS